MFWDGNDANWINFGLAAQHPTPFFTPGYQFAGTAGSDQIWGSDPDDQYRSTPGGQVHDQNLGHDTLSGGTGNDWVHGRGGNDVLNGGDGIDTVVGGLGDDALNGNMGNDHLEGEAGNDTIRGGQNDDVILGQDGADFLSGDAGNDALYGGAGGDTFNFFAGAGSDVVVDFNRGEGDSVRIESGTYSLAQVGANTIVTMNDGSTLTLQNVTYTSLDGGWIHY